MAPLERLFLLEVEFHRKLRTEASGTADTASLHTSYALQGGYEQLLREVGHKVEAEEIERLASKMAMAGDARDVLKARDSLRSLLGIRQFGE